MYPLRQLHPENVEAQKTDPKQDLKDITRSFAYVHGIIYEQVKKVYALQQAKAHPHLLPKKPSEVSISDIENSRDPLIRQMIKATDQLGLCRISIEKFGETY